MSNLKPIKIGRNDPCPCGAKKADGTHIKYKYCCLNKDLKFVKITRRDFISGPYKKCPNPKCLADKSFGVLAVIEGERGYTRECVECGYQENFSLPKIKKKVLYLDQFVISNLIKLLDKSHPRHEKIKAIPFWSALFEKLEAASRVQAIVCPDSFYHRDESLAANIDFKLARRLYEHFSSGKTLYPSVIIEKNQITQHFRAWLEGQKNRFNFDPSNIAFEGDLHTWSVGMRISVGGNPYPGQLDNIKKTNALVREKFKVVWARWQKEKQFGFIDRIKEETLELGKGLLNAARQYEERRAAAMAKLAEGQKYDLDLDDFFSPLTNDILEEMIRAARAKGLQGQDILAVVIRYFNDVDALLEIPQVRISSVMIAGLAHRAATGKKEPPKSTTDIQFISSYLPYCDALFVDKESASLLKEFPKGTPPHLKLKEFSGKIFSLANKEEFLDYLDRLVTEIPKDQAIILKDMAGESYTAPYWNIIEDEKKRLSE
ncbi:MAG: hypothetical protein WC113_02045 [Candidatus Paceibacterota bacterium]|jgi:Zn ribbon nucleic-acid-binding protein